MDAATLFREFTIHKTELLTEIEKQRMEEILEIVKLRNKKQSLTGLYEEYRKLFFKEKESRGILVYFDMIQSFLGDRYSIFFTQLTKKVPDVSEGDQYRTWERSKLNDTSKKEVYAYYMHMLLRNYDFFVLNNFSEDQKDYFSRYVHDHILGPADIVAAKAEDNSREVTVEELLKLLNEFLLIVKSL